MTTQSKIEHDFVNFLKASGFSDESIIYEPAFQAVGLKIVYRPDFALIHSLTKEPLAVVEVKEGRDRDSLQRGIDRIREYVNALRDKSLKAFVAIPALSGVGFDLFVVEDDGSPKQVPDASLLSYSSLLSSRFAEKKEQVAEEKKDVVDQFSRACKWAAIVIAMLAIADFFVAFSDLKLLTAERMTLLGVVVFLVVLPYAQKFKWIGLEWERYSGDKKN